MAERRILLVYTWDGIGVPLGLVEKDQEPAFDVVVFDYSGTATPIAGIEMISVRTECKGEIFREVHRWVAHAATDYEYIGLIDDDIETRWSDLNRLMRIAREHRLDIFVAALSHDSYYSHHQFLRRNGADVRPTAWIEVMMPFYRTELFMAGGDYYANSISSYGIDQFAMPTLQRLRGFDRVAIIDAVVVRHRRPITSDDKMFANGRNAHQERRRVRRKAMAQVAAERPDLLGSAWFFDTFAPWDGPARFLPLRLLAPALWLRAWRSKLRRLQSVPAQRAMPRRSAEDFPA
jgi:hypothetical protein